jgi:hypothetical protein
MLGGGVGEERCRDHATPPSVAASGSSVNNPRRAALGRTQVNKPTVAGIDGGGAAATDERERGTGGEAEKRGRCSSF